MTDIQGEVYMLCYDKPLGDPNRPRMSARHYVGWRHFGSARIDRHRDGTSGVPIVTAFYKRGIPFEVSRTMRGTRTDERRIKAAGNHARNCPRCSTKPGNGGWRSS